MKKHTSIQKCCIHASTSLLLQQWRSFFFLMSHNPSPNTIIIQILIQTPSFLILTPLPIASIQLHTTSTSTAQLLVHSSTQLRPRPIPQVVGSLDLPSECLQTTLEPPVITLFIHSDFVTLLGCDSAGLGPKTKLIRAWPAPSYSPHLPKPVTPFHIALPWTALWSRAFIWLRFIRHFRNPCHGTVP